MQGVLGEFQSTPPCGGRPAENPLLVSAGLVSIHAPVRGATQEGPGIWRHRAVSIHAPVRGATSVEDVVFYSHHCFNPRPRAGGDDIILGTDKRHRQFQSTPPCGGRLHKRDNAAISGVSIHAPVRGATWPVARWIAGRRVSIHAPVRGATGTAVPDAG